MQTGYRNRFNGQIYTKKEVDKKIKTLNLYNQLHNTDYNMDSLGLQAVISHHGFQRHNDTTHFIYRVNNNNHNVKEGR